MVHFERTVLPVAVGWLVATGNSVAGVTVVSVAVAEPEGDGAAPLALEVDVFSTVLVTVLDARADQIRRALWTNQVFLAVLASCCHVVAAVVQAAKVGIFALKAHVVGALEHGEGLQVVVEPIGWVLEPSVLFQPLQTGPLNSLLFDHSPNILHCSQVGLQRCAVVQLHRLLAGRAVHEGEDNPRRRPLVLNYLLHAIDMEDVSTA